MNSQFDLDTRGKQLRLDLEELYSRMRRDKALRPGSNDISDFIKRYIPEGMSFDDAEHILRSAGISVGERARANVSNDPHWVTRADKDDVVAATLFPSGFMSRAELLLALRPKSEGDYSDVKSVLAFIILTFP